jgi:cytochrome c oxidase subunit II
MGGSWARLARTGRYAGLLLLGVLLLGGCGMQMYEGGTSQGREIHGLWNILIISGGIVFVAVEALILWAVFRYRRRPGDDELPKQTHGNNLLEIVWTIVPLLIVTALFVVSWQGINKVNAQAASPDRTLAVEGFQWQWAFTYVGEQLPADPGDEPESLRLEGTIAKPPEIVLPVGETVRFQLQAKDVIHSFFVPGFNFKRDVVPGRTNSFDITVDRLGTYPGQCAEYCGLAHNDMHFTVRVVPQAEFDTWLQRAKEEAGAGCPEDPNPNQITSKDVAFNKNCLSAEAGEETDLQYTNDEAVPHNVAVFAGNDATGQNVFKGEVITGPKTVTYKIPALEEGDYFFHCDLHPDAMKGKFVVK